jgi:hypothetical protein
MGGDRSRWTDGQDAWQRLAAGSGQAGGGDPLAALSDIGQLRRLLDETELEAVREARRAGKSWAEIAIKLGVTRQSAWERWRDLDAEPAASTESRNVGPSTPPVIEHAARAARRRSWIVVPDVVGMSFDEARSTLAGVGLFGVVSDADGPSPDELEARYVVVTDQSPESGARALPGAPVRLWTERGGGSGVREPRRPKPRPRVEHERLDDPIRDSLG